MLLHRQLSTLYVSECLEAQRNWTICLKLTFVVVDDHLNPPMTTPVSFGKHHTTSLWRIRWSKKLRPCLALGEAGTIPTVPKLQLCGVFAVKCMNAKRPVLPNHQCPHSFARPLLGDQSPTVVSLLSPGVITHTATGRGRRLASTPVFPLFPGLGSLLEEAQNNQQV